MPRAKRARTNIKYTVNLSESERAELQQLLRGGRVSARRLTRARVLLKADEGLTDEQVADAIDVGIATVHRIRQRCVEDGLEAALGERARRGAPALLTGAAQAHLVAVACSKPPEGRLRWTLRLLADRVVELQLAERCSYETVRRVLKKTS
jgi:transposase